MAVSTIFITFEPQAFEWFQKLSVLSIKWPRWDWRGFPRHCALRSVAGNAPESVAVCGDSVTVRVTVCTQPPNLTRMGVSSDVRLTMCVYAVITATGVGGAVY